MDAFRIQQDLFGNRQGLERFYPGRERGEPARECSSWAALSGSVATNRSQRSSQKQSWASVRIPSASTNT